MRGESEAGREKVGSGSLFMPDRESVLVFGGIDPHADLGVGRNTGKDMLRYLPERNVWECVGGIPAPRHHHGVAFFMGKVYVCGKTNIYLIVPTLGYSCFKRFIFFVSYGDAELGCFNCFRVKSDRCTSARSLSINNGRRGLIASVFNGFIVAGNK